ncbi:LPS assembly lipoprotein LptE [Falsirhodobacter xinxiangensis]|uniref:LPS assembly lipoprotein LptE n=1 Tax=Falsirhodobacter xinxiangensis TaxID=2530049 RepID=UPI0010AA4978|nr:LPS assembly lipoprotein LptE [Rhodobacter xinxiangensis]
MSSPDRRTFLLLLGLGACGFTPAYGPGGPASALQDSIKLGDPTDKNGFDFVERMEERLGRGRTPRYELTYAIQTEVRGVGITRESSITRYNLLGRIDWGVNDVGTGQRVTGGIARNFTSYSATGSTVAGLAAEEDAAYRLMRILADQIATQLVATSGTWDK